MILMSKKMTSQKKLGEIKLVPYNKPLLGSRYRKCTLTIPTSSRTSTVTLLGAWCGDCLANKKWTYTLV